MSVRTTEANGYTFSVDTVTGTTVARGELQDVKASRNQTMQRNAGGDLRLAGDQGGHLVASRFNGPAIQENHFAQDGGLNQRQFQAIERAEHKLISNKENPASIQTERIAFMSGPQHENGSRPDAFMVNDTITYNNGTTQEIHLSFSNLSAAEQDALDRELMSIEMDHAPNPGDALRDSMTPEEYANLMEETEQHLPSLSDEFEPYDSGESARADGMQIEPISIDATEFSSSSWNYDSGIADNGAESDSSASWGYEVDSGWEAETESSNDNGPDNSPDNDCD